METNNLPLQITGKFQTIENRIDSIWLDVTAYDPEAYGKSYPSSDKYKVEKQKILDSFVGTMREHKEFEKVTEEKFGKKLEKERQELRNYRHQLKELFKSDLESYFNIEDNPKKEKLWAIASEKGENFVDIFNQYTDLVELIR